MSCQAVKSPMVGLRSATHRRNSSRLTVPSPSRSRSLCSAVTWSGVRLTPTFSRPKARSVISTSPVPSSSQVRKMCTMLLAQSEGLALTSRRTLLHAATSLPCLGRRRSTARTKVSRLSSPCLVWSSSAMRASVWEGLMYTPRLRSPRQISWASSAPSPFRSNSSNILAMDPCHSAGSLPEAMVMSAYHACEAGCRFRFTMSRRRRTEEVNST
mmetsp:Transcript_7216/g.16513  ORF Transcript_7216/g.16513 Transcript_7216/m.16513 type:complete len:213 (+) Transcript_7216:1248-1886(+)